MSEWRGQHGNVRVKDWGQLIEKVHLDFFLSEFRVNRGGKLLLVLHWKTRSPRAIGEYQQTESHLWVNHSGQTRILSDRGKRKSLLSASLALTWEKRLIHSDNNALSGLICATNYLPNCAMMKDAIFVKIRFHD